MYSQALSPLTSESITRCSVHSAEPIAAYDSSSKSPSFLRWGCVSERTCFSSNKFEPSRRIVHLGSNGISSRQYCHNTRSRILEKVTVSSTAAGFAALRTKSLIQVSRWRNVFNCPWILHRRQRLLELVRGTDSSCCWMRNFAAATVTSLVLQAITAQDISHALSSTSLIFYEPRLQLIDSTISPCIKPGSISCYEMRLGSYRCGAKKSTAGKSGQLLRTRAYATRNVNGASITRQGRGKPGFEGIVVRGIGGQLMAATKASSTALKASSSFALITGSLSSPLVAIAKAGSHVDLSVLRASFASSLNLISLCSFVVWMQRSGQLSAETPVVLSQVAFRVLIPCFLMTKVAVTLASHPTASLLFLPLGAIAQVLIGALLGKAACRLVYGESTAFLLSPLEAPMLTSPGSAPPFTTSETESGMITRVEKPLIINKFSRQSKQYIRVKKEAIITAACAFGNSFTLPLIFMTGVLGGEETSKIAGYLALFMVGWSPALWTVGYSMIAAGDEDSDSGESSLKDIFSWTSLLEGFTRIMNPPLYGVLIGVLVGGTPLSHLFLPVANGATISVPSTGALAVMRTSTAGILRPVFDAATLLGTATLAVQTIVLASSLAASLPPLDTVRDTKKSSRPAMEGVINSREPEAGSCSAELDSILDTRAFWIISSVRLVAMPVIVIISTVSLQCARILPIDPVYILLLLAESAMPSAQNLVLLSQLRASTRRLSGVLAGLLLRQYAMSIIPITFWMALFLAIAKPV
ncbi:hypothetical protein KC19_6G000700 [Ceratodon purpureus]|uniref:Uncharacterized protein n=2 Tax=Ceratodon purpureus TaxID=3225 RepID=A0A8T0H9S8_CERPU|nr:hypothetical protein KC19_6G000700 [Ceratodon purpureus]